jgi:trigger factor
VKDQLDGDLKAAARQAVKRTLLDALDERHAFDLPPNMVMAEFNQIWAQLEDEKKNDRLSDEDKDKTDEQLRAEYRRIAERRVRLGLVLAEIGRRNDVTVSEQEMNNALIAEARRYPGQEREVIEFYRQNAQAAAQLRAPVYEEKVVDLIFSRAQVENSPVTRDELFAEDDLPESYGAA